MVTLVAVVSVTTGVPGGFGRAVMVKKKQKKKQKLKQLKKKQKNVTLNKKHTWGLGIFSRDRNILAIQQFSVCLKLNWT